jgi:hypothetical protein
MRVGRRQGLARAFRAVAAVAAVGLAVSISACGSGDDENGGSPSGAGKPPPKGHLMKDTIPAQIDENPHGFVSANLLRPVTNAWRAAGRRQFTEVDAGALAADDSTGALAIFRHDYRKAKQDVNLVEVKDAGPLRITSAPVGRRVAESAQESGQIAFVSARGIRGTLDLADDKVRVRGR